MSKITPAGTMIFFDRMKRLLVVENGPLETCETLASGPDNITADELVQLASGGRLTLQDAPMTVILRIPPYGFRIANRVRFKRMLVDVKAVETGKYTCRNLHTGQRFTLARHQLLQAVVRGDVLGEFEPPICRNANWGPYVK